MFVFASTQQTYRGVVQLEEMISQVILQKFMNLWIK